MNYQKNPNISYMSIIIMHSRILLTYYAYVKKSIGKREDSTNFKKEISRGAINFKTR